MKLACCLRVLQFTFTQVMLRKFPSVTVAKSGKCWDFERRSFRQSFSQNHLQTLTAMASLLRCAGRLVSEMLYLVE